jgi:hypothetical protein
MTKRTNDQISQGLASSQSSQEAFNSPRQTTPLSGDHATLERLAEERREIDRQTSRINRPDPNPAANPANNPTNP